MHIQFDTNDLTPNEARALAAFLQALNRAGTGNNLTPASAPQNEEQAIFGVSTWTLQTEDQATGAQASQPTQQTETRADQPKRTRRTKAEIAADEAAAAVQAKRSGDAPAMTPETVQPTTQAEAQRVASDGHPEEAEAILADAKPITPEELRDLLNKYIAKPEHGMPGAIAMLQAFGCARMAEALALPADKLAELAEKLRG